PRQETVQSAANGCRVARAVVSFSLPETTFQIQFRRPRRRPRDRIVRRRVLAVAWTLPECLRCQIVRLSRDRWQVEVWRDAKRLRTFAAATIEAVHGVSQQWRDEFRAEIDARRLRGDAIAAGRIRRPRPAKAAL